MYAQLIGRAELCLVLLPAPNQLLQPNQPTAATKSTNCCNQINQLLQPNQLLHHVAPWAL